MILLVHDYVPYDFPMFRDQKDIDGTLHRGVENVKNLKNKWWIACGCCLGLYRDGDFCPTDTDIDIHIRVTHKDSGFVFDSMKHAFSDGKWELVREMYWNNSPMQLCYRDKSNGVVFDMIFMYSDVYTGSVMFMNEHGEMIHPDYDVRPFATKYGEFPLPFPVETYLEKHYGPTWTTPTMKKGGFTHDY